MHRVLRAHIEASVLIDSGANNASYIDTKLAERLIARGATIEFISEYVRSGLSEGNIIPVDKMIAINVIIRNEQTKLLETININTRVIDLHNVDLIIGRPEMIEHNLLTKMPSIILRERSLTNTVGKHDTLNTIYAKRDLLSYAEDDDGIVYDDVEPPYSTHEYNKNNNETDDLLPEIKGEGELQQRLRDLCIDPTHTWGTCKTTVNSKRSRNEKTGQSST